MVDEILALRLLSRATNNVMTSSFSDGECWEFRRGSGRLGSGSTQESVQRGCGPGYGPSRPRGTTAMPSLRR